MAELIAMEMTTREWGLTAVAIVAVIMVIIQQIEAIKMQRELRIKREPLEEVPLGRSPQPLPQPVNRRDSDDSRQKNLDDKEVPIKK